MTPEQDSLVQRLRALLADERVMREVSMFGGRSVMVNEKMIVSALKDGNLLVRVDSAQHDELLAQPGATQAEMGPGRDMGPGWIEVTSATIENEEQLSAWVRVALRYNREVTGVHS
ncbi:TfoX/Sxy family protein [Microbacterium aurantiacum]|uniref:TfoX/Sxy family protein n=1 Tax=Microbacterium aurantiacum TaxID=162393 RepID=UPI001F45E8FD|nr:TfoX/Sxy family protein [Microbacterium aurantiacum]